MDRESRKTCRYCGTIVKWNSACPDCLGRYEHSRAPMTKAGFGFKAIKLPPGYSDNPERFSNE